MIQIVNINNYVPAESATTLCSLRTGPFWRKSGLPSRVHSTVRGGGLALTLHFMDRLSPSSASRWLGPDSIATCSNTVDNVKPVSLQWNKNRPCRHLLIIQLCVSNLKSERSITLKEKLGSTSTIHIKAVQCDNFFPICKLIIVHVS